MFMLLSFCFGDKIDSIHSFTSFWYVPNENSSFGGSQLHARTTLQLIEAWSLKLEAWNSFKGLLLADGKSRVTLSSICQDYLYYLLIPWVYYVSWKRWQNRLFYCYNIGLWYLYTMPHTGMYVRIYWICARIINTCTCTCTYWINNTQLRNYYSLLSYEIFWELVKHSSTSKVKSQSWMNHPSIILFIAISFTYQHINIHHHHHHHSPTIPRTMSSMNFSSSKQYVRPPQRGVFQLDHDAECKPFIEKYMACLNDSNDVHHKCKELSKEYLQCRIDRQLMSKENLDDVSQVGAMMWLIIYLITKLALYTVCFFCCIVHTYAQYANVRRRRSYLIFFSTYCTMLYCTVLYSNQSFPRIIYLLVCYVTQLH